MTMQDIIDAKRSVCLGKTEDGKWLRYRERDGREVFVPTGSYLFEMELRDREVAKMRREVEKP